MPLFKRKPFPLAEPPEDLKPNDLVFQIRFTREIFKDYQEYLKRINHYRQRVWICKVTGKTNLTYEEALVSERCATEKVQQFPKELIGRVLRTVQFNILRLKELLSTIYNDIKDVYLVGEELSGRKGSSLSPCKILKVIQEVDDEDGTFKYEIGWLDKNKEVTDTSVVSTEALVRKKPLATKDVLKSIIRESTCCSTPCWVVYDELAKKYRLPTDPPDDLKDKIIKQEKYHDSQNGRNKKSSMMNMENRENGNKKRKKNETEGTEEPNPSNENGENNNKKQKKKETEETEEGSKGKKEKGKVKRQPEVEPIKYPIEDSLVQPALDDPVFTERPIPATDFLMPMNCVGDLLMIWDFCTSFSKVLHLSPFSLEDFEKAIDYKEGDLTLLAETHFALLRVVVNDSSTLQEQMQKRKVKWQMAVQNWQDHLCEFFVVEGVGKFDSYLEQIRNGNYSQLDPRAKLDILHELVDRTLPSDVIRGQLDEYIEERQALAATKREEEMEESRRKKEEQQQLKQQNAEKKDVDGSVMEENGDDKTMHSSDLHVLNVDSERNGSTSDSDAIKSSKENGVLSENQANGKLPLATSARRAALQQKQYARAVEEREKELARSEEQKILQEKRREQRQRELRELEIQKRKEHLEREMEKRFIRTNSLGKDRNHNRYWFFRREGRLFVESEAPSQWSYYSAKEELEVLMGSLNPKGERECALQRQLEKHYAKIIYAMQKRSRELAQKFAMEEAALRRSTRVRTQQKGGVSGFISYVNKIRG